MKFLVKVWTQSPFHHEGFTEVFDERRLDAELVAQLAVYLSHAAANSDKRQEATITIYKEATTVGEAKINLDPGLTIRKGKTAYRDYTPEVSSFITRVKNRD
jgi:hypothetical protein